MTKYAIVNDTHRGARGNHPLIAKYQKEFWEEQFFPYIDKHGITEVIHAGDYFDSRKSLNIKSLREDREQFVDPLVERGIKLHIIPGNHDAPFKDTLDYNSVEEYFRWVPNCHVYNDAAEIDDGKVLLVPWICSGNKEFLINSMMTTEALICIGHFELKGFDLYPGVTAARGYNGDALKHFDMVLSGHYHTKSSKGNIHYLGSQYQMTWSDWGDRKGFHVLDTDSMDLEYIENNRTMYEKVFYDDTKTDYSNLDTSVYKDKILKVIRMHVKKTSVGVQQFDDFVKSLIENGAHEVKVTEPFRTDIDEDITESDEKQNKKAPTDTSDTFSLISSFIESTDMYEDDTKKGVKKVLEAAYNIAMAGE